MVAQQIKFNRSVRAFLSRFPLKDMTGHQKFLAVAAHCAAGDFSREVALARLREEWSDYTLRGKYNPVFYVGADEAGWINRTSAGMLTVTQEGFDHLTALLESKNVSAIINPGLRLFDKSQTHTFDKFLRGILARARKHVWIADSYVDETVFDTVLDVTPADTEIHLMYRHKQGSYDQRVKRFKKQYKNFTTKQYPELHDRFVVSDDEGYVIGPSIKDAAANSPALVVILDKKDSRRLAEFFRDLWGRSQ